MSTLNKRGVEGRPSIQVDVVAALYISATKAPVNCNCGAARARTPAPPPPSSSQTRQPGRWHVAQVEPRQLAVHARGQPRLLPLQPRSSTAPRLRWTWTLSATTRLKLARARQLAEEEDSCLATRLRWPQ